MVAVTSHEHALLELRVNFTSDFTKLVYYEITDDHLSMKCFGIV